MIYKLYTWQRDLNTDFTQKDCLFRAVTLTENDDLDKYSLCGNGIGFDNFFDFLKSKILLI